MMRADEIRVTLCNWISGWRFENLTVMNKPNGCVVNGILHFDMEYNAIPIQDAYSMEIFLPNDYPKSLPIVTELSEKIPRHEDYHCSENGILCLAVPTEMRILTQKDTSLPFFINRFIIPFLYANSYRMKYGKYPWSTLPHRWDGVLEYFMDFFNLKDKQQTLKFLKNLYKNNRKNLKKHKYCPCGSGRKFYECHKKEYEKLRNYCTHKLFKQDLENMFGTMLKNFL